MLKSIRSDNEKRRPIMAYIMNDIMIAVEVGLYVGFTCPAAMYQAKLSTDIS